MIAFDELAVFTEVEWERLRARLADMAPLDPRRCVVRQTAPGKLAWLPSLKTPPGRPETLPTPSRPFPDETC